MRWSENRAPRCRPHLPVVTQIQFLVESDRRGIWWRAAGVIRRKSYGHWPDAAREGGGHQSARWPIWQPVAETVRLLLEHSECIYTGISTVRSKTPYEFMAIRLGHSITIEQEGRSVQELILRTLQS
jgi:hypothetical protein